MPHTAEGLEKCLPPDPNQESERLESRMRTVRDLPGPPTHTPHTKVRV